MGARLLALTGTHALMDALLRLLFPSTAPAHEDTPAPSDLPALIDALPARPNGRCMQPLVRLVCDAARRRDPRLPELVDRVLQRDSTPVAPVLRLQTLAAAPAWTDASSRALHAFIRQSRRRPEGFQAIALAGALSLVPRAPARPEPGWRRGARLTRWSLAHAIDLQAEWGLVQSGEALRLLRACRRAAGIEDPGRPGGGFM